MLFDMDGVILDSEPLHIAAFQATLGRFGHDLDMNGYQAHFAGKTDEEGFKQYFHFINEAADIPSLMSEKAKTYLELAGDQLSPYQGIVPLIKELSSHVPLALVTGSLRSEVDVALKSCDLEDVFSSIVAAEDIASSKPNPEGYLKAAHQLNVAINDCVVVEDTPTGIKAAMAANADCIAVTNTHSKEELKAATKVVEKLSLDLF